MATYVICDQGELTSAANTIENYADFLLRKMEEYIKILAWAQSNGIKDNLISSELTSLAEDVKACVLEANALVDSKVLTIVNNEASEIKSAERFSYPASLLDEVTAIFGQFH